MTYKINLQITPTPKKSHIEVASGLLQETSTFDWFGERKRLIAVISDTNVVPLHAKGFINKMRKSGFLVKIFSFPAGEENKNQDIVNTLQEQLLDWGMDRDGLIIGLGGGVATDIAGYVAATLLRGVEFIAIPTTLLAMVDASVGGKTGINMRQGKNLVGAFWQPTAVLIDPNVLQTLPHDCLVDGIAEMLKHGLIIDADYFEDLVKDAEKMLRLDPKTLEKMIAKSCEIKTAIVAEDERERSGKRRLLNFGHTIGHALELVSEYRISHGQAVAIGIVIEAEIAIRLGMLVPSTRERIIEAFDKYGISTKIPHAITKQKIEQAMIHDKKTKDGKPRFVLLDDVGSCDPCNGDYCTEVDQEIITEMLDALCVDKT